MKILVSDPLSEEGLAILKEERELDIDVKTFLSAEELKKIIKDYDALIVRSSTKVTKEIIETGIKLKVIGRAGVGLDNVDVHAATLKGIVVMNTPGGNTISTAEHTMSMLLALSRNIPQANVSVKNNIWDRKSFIGVEIFGKTLGIIGLGRIGSEMAKRAISFGMRVIAYDPHLSVEKAEQLEVELVDLERLFSLSDYISVHVPLSDDTQHMIGDEEFKVMKKGARIINCARGGIIDEAALAEALESERVAGAALDVFETEPPKDSPLLKLNNCIVTPHLGASTEEAQVNVAVEIAAQVRDALLGRGIRNAVNVPSLEPEIFKLLEPYLHLAEKLGCLQAQLVEGRIAELKIRYSGEIVNHDVNAVTMALVKGLLTPVLQETVNYVNAMVIARERGIKVIESRSTEVKEFANLISVEVTTDKATSEVAGTLFTKDSPRIVKLNEFYVDAAPSGFMIIASNWDKPGIVGSIGTILGDKNINIAGMTFGRQIPGGKAITVLNVDSPVPTEVLDRIRKVENILEARLIKL